jgi:hypothetical protein
MTRIQDLEQLQAIRVNFVLAEANTTQGTQSSHSGTRSRCEFEAILRRGFSP